MRSMLTLAQGIENELQVSAWMGRIVGAIVLLVIVLLIVKAVGKKR